MKSRTGSTGPGSRIRCSTTSDRAGGAKLLDGVLAADALDVLKRVSAFVFAAFGRGLRTLPPVGDLSADQAAFVRQAVGGLQAESGRVSCHRLALFAELFRTREWAVAALDSLGNGSSLGMALLDAWFPVLDDGGSNRSVNRAAVKSLLRDLLPSEGERAENRTRCFPDLFRAARPGGSAEFTNLIHVLDAEVQLITLADPASSRVASGVPHYQIADDALVPRIRAWVN